MGLEETYRNQRHGDTYDLGPNTYDVPGIGPKYQLLVVDMNFGPLRPGDTPETCKGVLGTTAGSYDATLTLQPTNSTRGTWSQRKDRGDCTAVIFCTLLRSSLPLRVPCVSLVPLVLYVPSAFETEKEKPSSPVISTAVRPSSSFPCLSATRACFRRSPARCRQSSRHRRSGRRSPGSHYR